MCVSTDGPHLNSMLVLQEAGAKQITFRSNLLKKVHSLSVLSGELLQLWELWAVGYMKSLEELSKCMMYPV